MKIILLKELMQDRDYPTAGVALFDELVRNIDSSQRIVIDMSGVEVLPSMFLNTSIGLFIDKYGKVRLKEKISFSNITVSQAMRLKEYLIRY